MTLRFSVMILKFLNFNPKHEYKKEPLKISGSVLALTYFPGPSPDKYLRHW